MYIDNEISISLDKPNSGSFVNAVQDDGNTRRIRCNLFANGRPWNVPEDVTVGVAFTGSNGNKGVFDTLPDGSPAIKVEGNVATITLPRPMLQMPGTVHASIIFDDKFLNRLTSFPFTVKVSANPFAGSLPVEDYIRIQWIEDELDKYLDKAIAEVQKYAEIVTTAIEEFEKNVKETKESIEQTASEAERNIRDTADESKALIERVTGESQEEIEGTATRVTSEIEQVIDEARGEIGEVKGSACTEIEQMAGNARTEIEQNKQAVTAAAEESQRLAQEALSAVDTIAGHAESAENNAILAGEHKDEAARYAEAAKQVAEKNGYFYFEIEGGRLYETRTDNVSEEITFVVEEGRLIAIYE